jgi:hypothetical protein
MPRYQLTCDAVTSRGPNGSEQLGMLMTAGSELEPSIIALDNDTEVTESVSLVLQIFRGTREETSDGMLYPDHEHGVHECAI